MLRRIVVDPAVAAARAIVSAPRARARKHGQTSRYHSAINAIFSQRHSGTTIRIAYNFAQSTLQIKNQVKLFT